MKTMKCIKNNAGCFFLTLICLFPVFGWCAIGGEQAITPDRIQTRSWVNLERYSGSSDSVRSTSADFKQLAYELQTLRATQPVRMSAAQQAPYGTIMPPRNNLGNRVPLSLIHWDRTLEAVTPEQQRLAIITGVAPEPILTNVTIFAIALVRPTTYRGASVDISLAADDLFEETGSSNTIRTLRIDPGDGSGWQDFATGQSINASYDSIGSKTITIEATLSDGAVLLASSSLQVSALSTPEPTLTIPLAASVPYSTTTGLLYIYKSGPHDGLRCPVLVAEGFDMENDMDWDVLYNILNTNQLVDTIQSYGRDLIVLDYNDAMRDIKENAALARAAIRYVNANRNNASDKFTVIGASMGGLVTRIALADMDRNPAAYGVSDVDTWLSFDSPHEGANIPLGLQEFFAFFQGKSFIPASVTHFYQLVNKPAAKQMLLVHHSTTTTLAGNSTHDAFQADLRLLGYPSTCKKIAISNGSGEGEILPFTQGQKILKWDNPAYQWLFCDAACDIYAISTISSPLPTVFWGFHDTLAWFDETQTTQRHYYQYAIDNAPGGYRSSFQVLYDEILESGNSGSGDYCVYPNHCFIPTVSSLGISMLYYDFPLSSYSLIKALSPFDEIHTANSNEPHIDINAHNKRWFIRSILEEYDTDGDGCDDYQEYLIGTAYDSDFSKLEGAKIMDLSLGEEFMEFKWGWLPNVKYEVYFTENLASEWILVPPESYSCWNFLAQATAYLPRSSESGFYKIVSKIQDPVID